MQLPDSVKQFYKIVEKDDIRRFCLFPESTAPNFWKLTMVTASRICILHLI